MNTFLLIIKKKLIDALKASNVEIIDNTSKHKNHKLHTGNIIKIEGGSNIFNIGLALGLAGVISPAILIKAELMRDLLMIIITTIAAYIFVMQGGKYLSKSISLALLIFIFVYSSTISFNKRLILSAFVKTFGSL